MIEKALILEFTRRNAAAEEVVVTDEVRHRIKRGKVRVIRSWTEDGPPPPMVPPTPQPSLGSPLVDDDF